MSAPTMEEVLRYNHKLHEYIAAKQTRIVLLEQQVEALRVNRELRADLHANQAYIEILEQQVAKHGSRDRSRSRSMPLRAARATDQIASSSNHTEDHTTEVCDSIKDMRVAGQAMEAFLKLNFKDKFAVTRLEKHCEHQSAQTLETHVAVVLAYRANSASIDAALRQRLDTYYSEYDSYHETLNVDGATGSVDAAPRETRSNAAELHSAALALQSSSAEHHSANAKKNQATCVTPYDLAVQLGIERLQQANDTQNPTRPRKSPDRVCATDAMHAAPRD